MGFNKRQIIKTFLKESLSGPPDVHVLRAEGWLQDSSLRGETLYDRYFDGLDLHRADFVTADMKNTSFKHANLTDAVLAECRMQGADFYGATLTGANLTGADMRDVNLEKATLTDEQLFMVHRLLGATLPDGSRYDGRYELEGDIKDFQEMETDDGVEGIAAFYGVSVEAYETGQVWLEKTLEEKLIRRRRTVFTPPVSPRSTRQETSNPSPNSPVLIRILCGLSDQPPEVALSMMQAEGWFEGDRLAGTTLYYAFLRGAVMRGIDLSDTHLDRANLTSANLDDAILHNTSFEEANLKGASLQRADCYEALMIYADLSGADLREADLSDANLLGATLRGTKLAGAIIDGTTLRWADLREVDFRSLDFPWNDIDLTGVNLSGADLRGLIMADAELAHANLTGVDLTDADLDLVFLDHANLSGAKVATDQLIWLESLLMTTLPDDSRYDGRFNLPGDRDMAREAGYDLDNDDMMSAFYGVDLSDYQAGQAWARVNLSAMGRDD